MNTLNPSRAISISGEIVETLERKGECMAKIALASCHIFVPCESIPDAHLGDKVSLKITVRVQKLELDYSKSSTKL